jgi:peptidoglycan/xylan/chitin deacetylase (PgdA/CDA1 family)
LKSIDIHKIIARRSGIMRISVFPKLRITSIVLFAILALFAMSVFRFSIVITQEQTPIPISNTQERVVTLTFDDGPDPNYTKSILDILKEKQVRATFFVLGENVEANKDLLLRILKEGHEIANHGYIHDYSKRYSQFNEIKQADKAIFEVTGIHTYFYRPPGGFISKDQTEIIIRNGYEVIHWSVDSRDWSRPGINRIKNNVLSNVFPGAIVLFHDGGGMRSQTVKVLGQVIDELRANNYSFVTLRELFRIDSNTPNP